MVTTPSDEPESTVEESTAASTTYKVLGEFADASGAGVLGRNTADSGTPIGVEGAVPNASGYGLSTPDDARVGGVLEAATLEVGTAIGDSGGNTHLTLPEGGPLTVEQVLDLDGHDLDLNGGMVTDSSGGLTLGPTSIATDTASTFGESSVSVTHSETAVIDDAIELVNSSSVSRPDDIDSRDFSTDKVGLEFEPHLDLSGITATISSNTSGEETVYLYDIGGTELTSEPSPGAGNSVTLTTSLSKNSRYYVVIDGGGTQYTAGYYDNDSFPYTSSFVDITYGAFGYDDNIGPDPDAYAIKSLSGAPATGTATVEFARPASVRRWETASFQADQDGETVEVFVETSSDGGSTWTDWQSQPIGPGTALSAIPAGDHVRFRVELSRPDSAPTPRLTLLSRQYSP